MNISNKALLDERKKAWEDIKFRLEYSNFHKKRDLKIFESYFVRGAQPKLHPLEADPIPLVYRLWLSPEQSLEAWQAITEKFLAGPVAWETNVSIESVEGCDESWRELCKGPAWGWQIARSLRDSYEILMQHAASPLYNGYEPVVGSVVIPPLGFMGGAEKKLYEFMTGKIPGSEHFRYAGNRLFEPSTYFGHMHYLELCVWLDGKRPSNSYNIQIYMGEHWVSSMTADYMEKIKSDEAIRFYLTCYLQLIARYPSAGVEPERQNYCEELRRLLNAGPLPEPVKSMWAEAKQYRGRIDLNSYMQETPYYLGE